jgi:hypothetical protein
MQGAYASSSVLNIRFVISHISHVRPSLSLPSPYFLAAATVAVQIIHGVEPELASNLPPPRYFDVGCGSRSMRCDIHFVHSPTFLGVLVFLVPLVVWTSSPPRLTQLILFVW